MFLPPFAPPAMKKSQRVLLIGLIYIAATLLMVLARAANPDKLWQIVSQECVPGVTTGTNTDNASGPCRLVDRARGFVILKDIVGKGQFLLIPTQRLTGIESPELLAPDAPNYWAYAWEQRQRVDAAIGKPLARDQIGLEINSAAARSQLQLHIHIDCIRADLPQLLRQHQGDLPGSWQPLALDGHQYRVMRLVGDTLGQNNPFKLAAAMSPQAAAAMAAQSLLLTGAQFSDGSLGFYLIDSPVNFDRGEGGNAEVWLDHGCRL